MGRRSSMTAHGLGLAASMFLAPTAVHAQRTPDIGQNVPDAHTTRTFGTAEHHDVPPVL